jgi:hypothetical protein
MRLRKKAPDLLALEFSMVREEGSDAPFDHNPACGTSRNTLALDS